MKFKFQDDLSYQLDAINSVVDLFDGQPQDAERLATRLQGQMPSVGSESQASLDLDLRQEVGAVGNNLVLDHDSILNLDPPMRRG